MDIVSLAGKIQQRKAEFDQQVSTQIARGIPAIFDTKSRRGRPGRSPCFAVLIPGIGDSVAGQVLVGGTVNFLNLYNTVLVARLVLTWFPGAPPALVQPLSTVCDPYLNAFRGLLPPLGQIDLSPILAFTVLNVFQSASAALPCEVKGQKPSGSPLRLPTPWKREAKPAAAQE